MLYGWALSSFVSILVNVALKYLLNANTVRNKERALVKQADKGEKISPGKCNIFLLR